jgi:hypothetical protein
MIAAALALFLARPAPAAAAPAIDTDPRIELLGVVQLLSGERPDLPGDAAYREAVLARFSRYKDSPAVALYRAELRRRGRDDGSAIILLYYTAPPALALRDPRRSPPYLDRPGEAQRVRGFMAALRDFARESDFAGFYRAHRADYARVLAASRRELGVDDPLAFVERYLGMSLDARARWIVSPLYVPSRRNSFIVPYPDPETLPDPGPGPFEVTTIMAYVPGEGPTGEVVTQRHKAALWQEPLFVFVDPALKAFDAARGGTAESYYGAEVAACRRRAADCAKNWLIAALSARLDVAAFGAPSSHPDGRDPRHDAYAAALSARLAEYEKDRTRWPTLWSFLPRLMSVFPEKAGLAPPPPPRLKRARTIKDLFPGPPSGGR